MVELLQRPWPWYLAGFMIGLLVPALLLLGNKKFGISSSFRDICAACVPAGLSFFKYDWRDNLWNIFFLTGAIIGGFIAQTWMQNPAPVAINPETTAALQDLGIQDFTGLLPSDIFTWENLFSLKGLIFFVIGGFLVGFGTRYAGGCTSGHTIMGLADLQWPSLVASMCFMAGGFFSAHLLLPNILKWLN